MATQWYCDLMGRVVGPLTAEELLKKVRKGEFSAETLVRKDDSKWFPANQVNGLFEAAYKDSERPRPMSNSRRIDDYDY